MAHILAHFFPLGNHRQIGQFRWGLLNSLARRPKVFMENLSHNLVGQEMTPAIANLAKTEFA